MELFVIIVVAIIAMKIAYHVVLLGWTLFLVALAFILHYDMPVAEATKENLPRYTMRDIEERISVNGMTGRFSEEQKIEMLNRFNAKA